MPITELELSDMIKEAFNDESDAQVNPAEARQRQAQKLASAFSQFVVGRQTVVTGTSQSGGPVTGTGIIQE